MRSSFLVGILLCAANLYAQGRGPGAFVQENFRFRAMGPGVGNRIAAATGLPGDPSTYYVGAASGGVWKSTNGGTTWSPIFDSQPVAAIGALAVAPSDHKIIWAGTGEAWTIRDSDMMGDGAYKSTDAGQTWTHMGLDDTGRIGRIIVHPTNPDIVFACALGRVTGPQQERGVYRTTNGGKTWERVLFADANTGCSGLAMDAHNPRVLFAGMWQVEMHTYGMFSGGPSSGVYVSRDGGTKWTRIEGHGMPKSPVGKIDVAIAPTNLSRVYALIQTADQGSLWRSDDGGENWTVASWARALIGRAGYYIRLAVSPANENEVLVANSSFHLSTDGGKTFRTVPWGGDTHDIWIDPLNANRILVTHDGGMYMTTDHGRTSTRVSLPIGQMYHVAVDNDVPYKIYGNMQDDGTMRGPSNSPEVSTFVASGGFGRGGGNPPAPSPAPAPTPSANPTTGGTTPPPAPAAPPEGGGGGGFGGGRGGASTWDHALGGCESGFTLPDPTDPNIVWASCYGNEVTRYDYTTKLARSVSPWLHTLDSEPDKAKYRCHWTPPLAIDPFDHNTVYYGCQVIFRTSNGGTSWSVISPDLSTQDPSHNVSSGGIVGDNLGQFYGEVVFSIAPSEIQKGLIWAGTNDGKLWYTKDAGGHWNDVTKNISGLPPWGVISKIEPSHFDAATAYIAVDFHLADNRDPYLYKTTDFGQTWTKISGGLPKGPLAYARVIAENPNRKGMLFAGTGNALYYSTDDGTNWKQLKDGLPPAPVSWIVVQKNYHDLVVSTYGRGFYILEDITPLEDAASATDATARFFPPRPTYRLLRNGRALLNFSLKAPAKDPVKAEILDAKGAVIREIRAGTGQAGINRIAWDLRYEAPRLVALRTTPPENPHIWEEPRFLNATTRPVMHWGIQQAEVGPIAAPGKYTARLTVDGQTFTQPLEILRPPNSHGSDTDLQSAVRLQVKVRDDINSVSDMVNQIEWMRKQVEDSGKPLAGQKAKAALLKSMDALDRKMQEVEYKLITREDALSDDKYFTTAYKLYLQFIWLGAEIGTGGGDVAGSADYGPTETSIGLVFGLEKELDAVRAEYRTLMDKAIPAYNSSLSGTGVNPILTTAPPPARGNRAQ
ncbi:MAG TPA: sialidase [Bryobacteraceae bacterium]|nr:sialidase [Bryobacteraceae bacterium]